jgi:hypothetical protein
MATNVLNFAGALSYSAFRRVILQKIVPGQPLITYLILKSNFWIGKGGRTRKVTTVQEKVSTVTLIIITYSPDI